MSNDDIVARLRKEAGYQAVEMGCPNLLREAADAIEQLREAMPVSLLVDILERVTLPTDLRDRCIDFAYKNQSPHTKIAPGPLQPPALPPKGE